MSAYKIFTNSPIIGEYVNFIFTDRGENVLECILTDYDVRAEMFYTHLSLKKKIKSIQQITPLNKQLVGMVDSIENDTIQLSLASVDKTSNEYKSFCNSSQINNSFRITIPKYYIIIILLVKIEPFGSVKEEAIGFINT